MTADKSQGIRENKNAAQRQSSLAVEEDESSDSCLLLHFHLVGRLMILPFQTAQGLDLDLNVPSMRREERAL